MFPYLMFWRWAATKITVSFINYQATNTNWPAGGGSAQGKTPL